MRDLAVSEAFTVTNGVKQGCVFAPTLFSLMFPAMLMNAYREERLGTRIACRTDGHLLNQRRMHFQSRVSTTAVHELLLADDCALNATSDAGMKRSKDLRRRRLRQLQPGHQQGENGGCASTAIRRCLRRIPNQRGRRQLQVVDNFTRLDSIPSHNTEIDDEVARRISMASQAFDSLQNKIWNRYGLQLSTKPKMCKTVIQPTLLYGADLDGVHEVGTQTQPLPPQLSPTHTEAEVAVPNPRH
ncbi:hypothetical protein SprV_0702447800 [Sparganum proliferum]